MMSQPWQKRQPWLKMGFSMLLLCTCMVLIVGVAWGRYRTEITENIEYYPKQLSKIYLWGKDNGTGGFDALPNTWAVTQTESEVEFNITNGIPGAQDQEDLFTSQDLSFYIRVVATEGIRDGENLAVRMELEAEEGALSYDGIPVRIEENSSLHDSFGGGWVYCFYETDGKEAQWLLEGGELNRFTAKMICTAQNSEMDPSMLQLQVTAVENG